MGLIVDGGVDISFLHADSSLSVSVWVGTRVFGVVFLILIIVEDSFNLEAQFLQIVES